MIFVGDNSRWDDFFRDDFVPTILSLVLESWEQMPELAENAHEDHVTEKLYSALVSGKKRQSHFFLIRIQDVEFDTALEAAIGRKDLAFYPSFAEEIYFCLEAKRLNARVSGASKSLADEYVKDSMQRFVDRKYSPQVRHGGMLGYVLDGDIPRAIANVGNCIRLHHTALRMDALGRLLPSTVLPQHSNAKESHHRRELETRIFQLHHLFVSGLQLSDSPHAE